MTHKAFSLLAGASLLMLTHPASAEWEPATVAPEAPPAATPPLGFTPQELPPPDERKPRRWAERHNMPMMITGIGMVSVGGLGVLMGAMIAMTGAAKGRGGEDTQVNIGLAALGAGALTLGIGLPLLIIGGKRKGARPTTAWVGEPGPAGWMWRF